MSGKKLQTYHIYSFKHTTYIFLIYSLAFTYRYHHYYSRLIKRKQTLPKSLKHFLLHSRGSGTQR